MLFSVPDQIANRALAPRGKRLLDALLDPDALHISKLVWKGLFVQRKSRDRRGWIGVHEGLDMVERELLRIDLTVS